jgi:tetratricopeptide (TPR) repeat protein
MPSIRIAAERLLERDPEAALHLLVRLYPFWMERTSLREALRWLTAALERSVDPDPGLASRALADASTMSYFCGDLGQSRTLSERSIALAEQHGLPGRPSALLRLAALQAFAGEQEAAERSGEQALDSLEVEHRPPEPPEAMGAVGAFLALAGQPDRGIEVCRVAIDRHRGSSPTTQASDLVNLAYAYQLVDPARAVDTYLAAAERARAAGSRFSAATAAMGAGLCLRASGRPDDALVVLAEALPLARDLGMRHEVIVMVKVASRILRGKGSIDGDVLLLIADREQRAGQWEGSPTLGRRERRSPAEIAAEIGEDYPDIAAAAAELELDEAIDIIGRIAAQARVAVSAGAQRPSTAMGTSGSNDAP